eukprot:g6700.t1
MGANTSSPGNTNPFCKAVEQGDKHTARLILSSLSSNADRVKLWKTPINGFSPIFWLSVNKIKSLPNFHTISSNGFFADGANLIMDDVDNVNLDKFALYADTAMGVFAKDCLSEKPGYLTAIKAESDENGVLTLSEKNIIRANNVEIRITSFGESLKSKQFPYELKLKSYYLLNTDENGNFRIMHKPNIFGAINKAKYGLGVIEFVVCGDLNYKLHYDMTDNEIRERDAILQNKAMTMNVFEWETALRLKTKTQKDPKAGIFYHNIVDKIPASSKRKVRKNNTVNIIDDNDESIEKSKGRDEGDEKAAKSGVKEEEVVNVKGEKETEVNRKRSIYVKQFGTCVVTVERKRLYIAKVNEKKYDSYNKVFYRKVMLDLSKTKRMSHMQVGDLVSNNLKARNNKEDYQFRIKSIERCSINNIEKALVLEDIKDKDEKLSEGVKELLLYDNQPGLYTDTGRVLYLGDL